MTRLLTREEFERSREDARKGVRRHGRILAFFSVALGMGQLFFLKWADVHMERGAKLAIAIPCFVAYMVVVCVGLWRLEQVIRSVGPSCPQCGVRLRGLSERLASATGRCDGCGGKVVVDGEQTDRGAPGQPPGASLTG